VSLTELDRSVDLPQSLVVYHTGGQLHRSPLCASDGDYRPPALDYADDALGGVDEVRLRDTDADVDDLCGVCARGVKERLGVSGNE